MGMKVVMIVMKTSQYNKRITIQSYSETKNTRGISKKEWKDLKKVWANINTNIERTRYSKFNKASKVKRNNNTI